MMNQNNWGDEMTRSASRVNEVFGLREGACPGECGA